MYNNPFSYSDDNLRYHSYSYYLKHKYGRKIAKVPLDAGFTCPNRDGKVGVGGCLFCSARGSGDFVADNSETLEKQYEEGLAIMREKWPDALGIAYFQAYSNTYAPLDQLKKIYDPFFHRDDIVEISIATRPDCLDEDKIAYFQEMNQIKPLCMEMGLQSIHPETMNKMNRGHALNILTEKIRQLQNAQIRICLHIINSLPNETEEMMIETARFCADWKVNGIKIHMLNILNDAAIKTNYLNDEFELLSREKYIDTVVKQLEVLPPEMVIERLTGDGMADNLLAPKWIVRKTTVLNDISKRQKELDSYQGKYYETGKH